MRIDPFTHMPSNMCVTCFLEILSYMQLSHRKGLHIVLGLEVPVDPSQYNLSGYLSVEISASNIIDYAIL